MTSHELITLIAETADRHASLAGVGACETAGLIISYLHANPECIDGFIESPSSVMIDDERFEWRNGSLTWHATNGKIVSPKTLRDALGVKDQ